MNDLPEIYISSTNDLDEEDFKKINHFLDEVTPIYNFYVEKNSGVLGWRLDFPTMDMIVTFMRSFYSQKYILKTIPSICNIYVLGQSQTAQMLIQQNVAIMTESIADNADAGEYVMNDQIREVMSKVHGIDEFNKRNNLYTFKHVIEALLDNLSNQGLVKNSEGIKTTIFGTSPTTH